MPVSNVLMQVDELHIYLLSSIPVKNTFSSSSSKAESKCLGFRR